MHLCVSIREGYGHYLHEGMAAGALVVSTWHPPMNEFIEHGVNGMLILPDQTSSDLKMALGWYGENIDAHMSSMTMCRAMEVVMMMSVKERRRMGQAARQEYLRARCVVEAPEQELRKFFLLVKRTASAWSMSCYGIQRDLL